MMIRHCTFLFSLFLVGCLGDGGGTAYQASPVGNEPPNSQEDPFDAASGSGDSPDFSDDQYEVCMDLCTEEADEQFCREEVCFELQEQSPGGGSNGNGSGGNVNYCADYTAEQMALIESFPPACRDCICSTDPVTADENSCVAECNL